MFILKDLILLFLIKRIRLFSENIASVSCEVNKNTCHVSLLQGIQLWLRFVLVLAVIKTAKKKLTIEK